MKKRRSTWVMAILLAGALALTSVAVGQGAGFRQGRTRGRWEPKTPMGRLIKSNLGNLFKLHQELDLTKEQKTEIKKVFQENKEEIRSAVAKIVEKKRALRDEVLDERPTERRIRNAADDLGDAIGDAAVLLSEMSEEIRPVLTEEQREIIEESRRKRDESVDIWLEEMLESDME